MSPDARVSRRERLRRLRLAFSKTREADRRLVPLMAAVALAALLVCGVIGALLGQLVAGLAVGVPLALLGGVAVFGRRTTAVALGSIEGRPGAAAAVLQGMRGPWRVTPAVAFTRKQDFVHRVVGRPGVILVGEGAPARVGSLLRQERRKVARVAGDTPVHEVSVGDREGQVPLGRLQVHLARLPRALKARGIGALDTRLSALGGSDVPLPKGPLPRGRPR
ncbi:MAG TPA: DUF4191 domain-containing protein [Egibacteraceae bacterium]|nr:DUF4191 domain-containing protein [Egibacteraceae bacterium]